MSLGYWQQLVKADPTAYADLLDWITQERFRLAKDALRAASWDALLAIRGEEKMYATLEFSFTLPDLEESNRAEYRRRNA